VNGMRRRQIIALSACGATYLLNRRSVAFAVGEHDSRFIAEAVRMKEQAVASGDQPFGAVLVKAGLIVGYGPSRVILTGNPEAHAERVALWDAQKRLDTKDMTGAILYSTSRACVACEHALALANIERMYFGSPPTAAGKPKRSP
jgi:guanine deaminase